jgi:hypothetical protein
MGIATVPEMEVQRLVHVGLLAKGMNYRVSPSPETLLTFCNRLEGRMLFAEISVDESRSPLEALGMVVTEKIDGEEPELVSTYRHSSLEHLIRVGKGFLCYQGSDRKVKKKTEKTIVTIRVEEDLHRSFETAVEALGESRAVVLRQLMRFFVGKGPDPRFTKRAITGDYSL